MRRCSWGACASCSSSRSPSCCRAPRGGPGREPGRLALLVVPVGVAVPVGVLGGRRRGGGRGGRGGGGGRRRRSGALAGLLRRLHGPRSGGRRGGGGRRRGEVVRPAGRLGRPGPAGPMTPAACGHLRRRRREGPRDGGCPARDLPGGPRGLAWAPGGPLGRLALRARGGTGRPGRLLGGPPCRLG